jgi:NADPH-dependent ferric siderophore reductase
MPKATKPVATEPEKVEEATQPVEAAPAEKAPKKPKKTSFDVLDRNGGLVRTYSVERHGEEAGDLAEEFVSHHDGYTIV